MFRIFQILLLIATGLPLANALSTPITRVLESGRICDTTQANIAGVTYLCYQHEQFGAEVMAIAESGATARLVKDLNVGPSGSTPFGFIEFGDQFLFFAKTAGSEMTLWKSDGSSVGTQAVKPIPELSNGGAGSIRQKFFAGVDGVVFIQFNHVIIDTDGTADVNNFIIVTDGTADGTHVVEGWGRRTFSEELYYYSTSGDIKVATLKKINSSGVSSTVLSAVGFMSLLDGEVDGKLVLFQFDFRNPGEYQKWFRLLDPDGPDRVLFYRSGVRFLGLINSTLFFSGCDGLTSYSPPDFQFSLVTSLYPEGCNEEKNRFQRDGRIFFASDAGTYITDGTASGTELIPIRFAGAEFPYMLGTTLLGVAQQSGNSLGASDGTASGTTILRTFPSDITRMFQAENWVFIVVDKAIWRTDGTIAGTAQVADYSGETVTPELNFNFVSGNTLFFDIQRPSQPALLVKTTSSPVGAALIYYSYDDGTTSVPAIDDQRKLILIPATNLLLEDSGD